MATTMERRRFLQMGLTGLAALALGTQAERVAELTGGTASAATRTVRLTIGEALVEMIDLTPIYMWTFGDEGGPRVPGPNLQALEGDTIDLAITNTLDEPHAFAIAGTGISTGPIAPGDTALITFTAPAPGTYIYLDPLEAPVNRLLGLHGSLVVLPTGSTTPYAAAPPALQRLFNDLGNSAHFPGEPWRPERTRIWHLHTIDPRLHARARAGTHIDPGRVVDEFIPSYFLLNGESGFFASHNPSTTPSGRIGQPHLIRMVNTGLVAHSLHNHGNHVYLTSSNGVPSRDVEALDSWRLAPLERADWLLPFMRPPDIPGPEDRPLREVAREELAYRDGDYGLPQSPIEYPMHCHTEQSQTAAGGNYPSGLVTHWQITGDLDGVDFPGVHTTAHRRR